MRKLACWQFYERYGHARRAQARFLFQWEIKLPLKQKHGTRRLKRRGDIRAYVITLFQSVGRKVAPLILSLLRKGCLDVPLMFLMNNFIGVNGIAWATPMADFTAMLTAICVFVPFWMKLKKEL